MSFGTGPPALEQPISDEHIEGRRNRTAPGPAGASFTPVDISEPTPGRLDTGPDRGINASHAGVRPHSRALSWACATTSAARHSRLAALYAPSGRRAEPAAATAMTRPSDTCPIGRGRKGNLIP